MEAERTQYLSFEVGDARYATPILKVREIVPLCPATRVPASPAWIRGVVNLRGQVLPVIDLAVKFGLPSSAATPRTCVIVFDPELEGQPTVVGAVVDGVAEVLELGAAEIEPPPDFGTQLRVDCLLGVASAAGGLVQLLDTDRVLFADQVLASVEAAGPASPAPTAASR